ncbi:MAG: hypothetical protein KC964_07825 [Candidatus Omnitrophica bacterium]|nr:hypothetical protein [Candidatus Omnitrophota bacterium]
MNRTAISLFVLTPIVAAVVWYSLESLLSKDYPRYRITDLGEALFTGHTHTLDINNLGEILVYYVNTDQEPVIFIRSATGSTKELEISISQIPAFRPEGFNDHGQILGEINSATGGAWTAIYDPASGTVRSLGPLGGSNGYATSLNNRGEVVGLSMQTWTAPESGFVWSSSTAKVIVPKATGVAMAAFYGINDHGDIVGYQVTSRGYPILRSATGTTTTLNTLGYGLSVAMGINNNHQIVGYSGVESLIVRPVVNLIDGIFSGFTKVKAHRPDRSHAFLWEDGVLMDLNDLIPEDSGWELIQAHDINDAGEIVGWGNYRGKEHAFLLTPLNAPPTDGQ